MSSFSQFTLLSDDLKMNVLSFAADAPFEVPHQRNTLTHVLPQVCTEFRVMCQSDFLWKLALERLAQKDPDLWQVGLLKLLPPSQLIPPDTPKLVEHIHRLIQAESYREVYQRIVQSHIRVTYSMFCMNGHARLNEPFALHFFEPRYRLLIREVMQDFPPDARQGNPIQPNAAGELPTFCYAHAPPFAPTSPACLVHVRTCNMLTDGRADVVLVPTAYVWIERLWERPNSGMLYEASCIRMGREATCQMEERAFRAAERHQQMNMFGHPGFVQDMLQFLIRQGGPEEGEQGDRYEVAMDVMEDFVDALEEDRDENRSNENDVD